MSNVQLAFSNELEFWTPPRFNWPDPPILLLLSPSSFWHEPLEKKKTSFEVDWLETKPRHNADYKTVAQYGPWLNPPDFPADEPPPTASLTHPVPCRAAGELFLLAPFSLPDRGWRPASACVVYRCRRWWQSEGNNYCSARIAITGQLRSVARPEEEKEEEESRDAEPLVVVAFVVSRYIAMRPDKIRIHLPRIHSNRNSRPRIPSFARRYRCLCIDTSRHNPISPRAHVPLSLPLAINLQVV